MEAFTGQLALEAGDGGEAPGRGSKRFRAGFEAAAATLVDASMGLADTPKGAVDPVEEYPTTQKAATKVLADAQAAAASAAAALQQRG